jgi:hypothetical protein
MPTLYLSNTKNEKCGLKKMSKYCQNKIFKKSSSNEEFISEVHWNFPYIYLYI